MTPTKLARHLPRVERPETLTEAIGSDRRTAAYTLRAGLCRSCANYAAQRHALGWLVAQRPPCTTCAPIVQAFPLPTADPAWRQYERGRVPALRASLTTSTAARGVSQSAELGTASTGKLAGRRVFGVAPTSAHALAEVTR